MVASHASEYIRIYDLPAASTLPSELRDKVLFSRSIYIQAKPNNSKGTSNTAEQLRGGTKATDFNYSKALKAALQGAGSSVISRGDGKFNDGKDFHVSDVPGGRAKFVHLTPDALAPGAAEKTLQELDRLQQQAGSRTPTAPAPACAPPSSEAAGRGRLAHQQNAAVFAAAAKVLYDICEEDGTATSIRTASTAVCASSTDGTERAQQPVAGMGLRTPQHSLRECPEGPTGGAQLEVSVLLPDVESPAEVEVWLDRGEGRLLQIAVPGRYQLKLDLPYAVLDDTSRAKWSKAKRRLTLSLTKAGR